MTPQELDAIRARDAAWNNHYIAITRSEALAAYQDRRDLLAEVDRLRALAPWTNSNHVQHDIAVEEGRLIERARVLPVIEAARYISTEYDGWPVNEMPSAIDALRAALAEYDR